MRAALAQAGLAFDERYVQYGPIDLAAAAGMMRRLLKRRTARPPLLRPTTCSRSARMMACREQGVRDTRRDLDHRRRQHRSRRNPDAGADQHPHAHRGNRPRRSRAGRCAPRGAALRRLSEPALRACKPCQYRDAEKMSVARQCLHQPGLREAVHGMQAHGGGGVRRRYALGQQSNAVLMLTAPAFRPQGMSWRCLH